MTLNTYNDLINHVDAEKLERFFRDRNNLFTHKHEPMPEYEDDIFQNALILGEIPMGLIEHVLVCVFHVTRELTERSGKKAQYDKAKKIIRDRGADAGIFVFIGENGNFRFSLVYANYLGTRVDYSSFRRFTYFVSPQLTNKTFIQRIGEGDFSSLESIKEAFSVEKVTKEFYQKISYWYFWACQQCQFPKDAEAEENGRQVAVIRLITRMIFIWFMREMKLVPNHLFDDEFVKKTLKEVDPGNSTYYLAVLQNLFFATLNTKPDERTFRSQVRGPKGYNPDFGNQYKFRYQDLFTDPDALEAYFGEIPFLNGGLFDCLDDKAQGRYVDGFTETKKHQPQVPNTLFFTPEVNVDLNTELDTSNRTYRVEGLINILSTYNFTIDENTLDDQDVALDPELLGKVFENLLASFNPETSTTARKATGSYYTPREIVDYMVEEALKGYFQTHLEHVEDLEDKLNDLFAQNTADHRFTDEEARRMVSLVENVRIVDPAVGSGAFPMGALNKLVFILSKLDKDNALWKKAQLDAADAISDPAIRKQVIASIETYFREKDANYGRKLYLIQKCIYGVDIQQIAVEIAKLRFFIALLVDEKVDKSKENWGIEPLPNLDFKIMQGNSLISEYLGINFSIGGDAPQANGTLPLFEDENKRLIEQFDQKKIAYQTASDPQHKKALQGEIEDLLIKIFEDLVRKQKAEYFQRLEAIERKYTAVPDLRAREKAITEEKGQLAKSTGFDLDQVEIELRQFTSKQRIRPFFPWELYFSEVFLEKGGFDIVIGNPPYIDYRKINKETRSALNKFDSYRLCRTGNIYVYFIELGLLLLRENGELIYINPYSYLVADSGFGIRKLLLKKYTLFKVVDVSNITIFSSSTYPCINLFLNKNNTENRIEVVKCNSLVDLYSVSFFVEQSKSEVDNYRIVISENIELLTKISQGKGVKHLINYCEIFCGTSRSGFGRKIINQSSYQSLSDIDKEKYYPIIQTSNIQKYRLTGVSNYIPSNIYPKHVQKKFFGEKVFFGRMTKTIRCAFSDELHFGGKINVLVDFKINPLYILGLLNSKLISFWYVNIFESTHLSGGYLGFDIPSVSIIPIRRPSSEIEKNIINLVSGICEIYSREGEDVNTNSFYSKIDTVIYSLYGLNKEEILEVETWYARRYPRLAHLCDIE